MFCYGSAHCILWLRNPNSLVLYMPGNMYACADGNADWCLLLGLLLLLLQDPNSLVLYMPGDMSVRTRVMRRSEQQTGDDRLETSEFMQQVFDSGDPGENLKHNTITNVLSGSPGFCNSINVW
jgi:hypothetical protein